jgi:transposase
MWMSKWDHDFSEAVGARLEPMMAAAKTVGALRRIQAIYFRARYKDTAEQVASRTGLSLQTVRNLHSAWRHRGEEALEIKGKGGRRRENLTIEEERALLLAHRGQAERGGILEVSKIHRACEEALGEKQALSTTYRMLHRHGWRKIAPRPKHPKGDAKAQEAFKKTGRRSLKKQSKKPTQ